jgi:aspartate/methionine/tyrosine aminotransferase
MKLSQRAQRIEPFYVMEMGKTAAQLAQQFAHTDRPMIALNIGEPDFTAPPGVQAAAEKAIRDGHTQYSHALGLPALRERISHWYQQRWNLNIDPGRIVVTAGASAALHLACLALVDEGDEVLLPDPSYPCNRQFVQAAGGRAVLLPTDAAQRYQLQADQVRQAWGPHTQGVLLASPSNPTGTSIHPDALREIDQFVQSRGGVTLVDEIYLGLSYDATYGQSALHLGEHVLSINSFSKYFHMTGWRLGWLVAPPSLVPVIESLAQHLFICPNAIAQRAALACFEPDNLAIYEQRRTEFQARRDMVVPALNQMGMQVSVVPDGAFYAWAHVAPICERMGLANSWDFCLAAMQHAHVAMTPGRDFGHNQTEHHVRLSTASSLAQLQQATERLKQWVQHG